MKQQDFLELIKASQSTLKQELLKQHPESKYQFLMLIRSLELLREYINQAEIYQVKKLQVLTHYFQMPILKVDEGVEQLCQDIRLVELTPIHTQELLQVLRELNQIDLQIVRPQLAQ